MSAEALPGLDTFRQVFVISRQVAAGTVAMTFSGLSSLSEHGRQNGTCGSPRAAPDGADAGQGPGDGARRRGGVVLRAEVGRLPGAGVPRRRRRRPAVAQRQGPGPLLPRAGRRAARRAGAAVRARRRGRRPPRDRRPHPAGLGVAEPAHPPRRAASGCSPSRRPRTSSASTRWPSATRRCCEEPFRLRRQGSAGRRDEKQWCHVTRTTEDPELGRAMAEHVRGRRPRRGDRQATRRCRTCRASGRW